MKRQKIYRSREMILRDIDAANRKAGKLLMKIQELDAEAAFYRELSNGEKYRQTNEECDRISQKLHRLQTTRLKRLQNTLAMWDTETFAVDGLNEKQVVLQKA